MNVNSVAVKDVYEPVDGNEETKNSAVEKVKEEQLTADGVTEKVHTPSLPFSAWCILLISCTGGLLASISTTALIIAFPTLLAALDMTISTMMWVLLIVLLMIGAIVPTAGKLGDMFGQAAVYKTGYVFFVVGSLGAGFVSQQNKGYDLVAARVVIGIGAALLFTNSNAILTNAFAPYKKVGLSQGLFQLSLAMGVVFGPLIGGAFATTAWRWIFWFNVPPGGVFCIAAFLVVQDKHDPTDSQRHRSFYDKVQSFDYIGAFGCSIGLVLLLIAMIQAVSPTPALSTAGALAGLVVAGCACGLAFIVDQFYATDPLIPPSIFDNRIFSVTTLCGTLMAFVRNSITYDMIFLLQGPLGRTPLEAGTTLIPYGLGIMFTGFAGGALSDKVGIPNMAALGPLITAAACAVLSQTTADTPLANVNGLLFVAGMGVGLFQSPNSTANMLSVDANKRGVAAAIGMLTQTFCMMVGIVLTFSLVLNYVSQEELFDLFIYGGGSGVDNTLKALAIDFYVLIAFCCVTSLCAWFLLPSNTNQLLREKNNPTAQAESSKSDETLQVEGVKQDEMVEMEEGGAGAVVVSSKEIEMTSAKAKDYQSVAVQEEQTNV